MPQDTRNQSGDYIYAHSALTGNWYKVYDWEDGEGSNITNTGKKEQVPVEEVPDNVLAQHGVETDE
jgi:hypothetical protein